MLPGFKGFYKMFFKAVFRRQKGLPALANLYKAAASNLDFLPPVFRGSHTLLRKKATTGQAFLQEHICLHSCDQPHHTFKLPVWPATNAKGILLLFSFSLGRHPVSGKAGEVRCALGWEEEAVRPGRQASRQAGWWLRLI